MKKTFRLIGMGLMAMAMCVNLSACSDDDDSSSNGGNGSGGGVNGSRIKAITTTWTNSPGATIKEFTYDNEGRIVRLDHIRSEPDEGDKEDRYITYEYSDSKIIMTRYEYNEYQYGFECTCITEFTLTDGKITEMTESPQNGHSYLNDTIHYEYNGDRLSAVNVRNNIMNGPALEGDNIIDDRHELAWEGDNIIDDRHELAWEGDNIIDDGCTDYTYTDIDASAGWNEYSSYINACSITQAYL